MSAPHSIASLTADLQGLGLGLGDGVVIHSSLRAVGPVAGGPEAVVDALLSTVGVEGLVVVPTFTYDVAQSDARAVPGRTGALAEAVRHRSEAIRSRHPFYSVAAIGPNAEELCEGHELRAATAVDTPLDRLAGAGGLVLLLGVDHTSNTTAHVGEFHANARYLDIPFDPDWPTSAEIRHPDGTTSTVTYGRFPGCSRAFGVLEAPLRESGAVRIGTVGDARAALVPGRSVIARTVALLQADEAALLCRAPDCYRCSNARDRLSRQDDRARGAAEDRAR